MSRYLFKKASRLIVAFGLVAMIAQMISFPPPTSAAKKNEPTTPERKAPPPPPVVKVNRTVPKVEPPSLFPIFSNPATDEEITRARVFEEPLVKTQGATSAAENDALAKAITRFLKKGDNDDVSPFSEFLKSHPKSPWRTALLTDLGILYRKTGYFVRALNVWEEAWKLGKNETEPRAKALVDRAVAELAELNSRLGRYERLGPLFAEVGDRQLRGSAAQKLAGAREGFWMMNNKPGESFLCGPFALDRMRSFQNPADAHHPKIVAAQSTRRGTSLAFVAALARDVKTPLQTAKRKPGTEIPTPAIVHWKAGHFASLLETSKQADGKTRYHMQDPTFGDDLWISQTAMDEEASGYFLIRDGKLPEGWKPVGTEEASKVWGKGYTDSNNPDDQTCGDDQSGGDDGGGSGTSNCASGNCGGDKGCPCDGEGLPPMATYRFFTMLAALRVSDRPLRYKPPIGPGVNFTVVYNQRDGFQPANFPYSNLGPKWTFNFLSYVEQSVLSEGDAQTAYIYLRGGGREFYTDYDNVTTFLFAPQFRSRAMLRRIAGTGGYRRTLPDGSQELYELPTAPTVPRQVLLTKYTDTRGNSLTLTYDSQFRLVAVTDAIGQVTTFSYENTDPKKITKVTDPFGRFATFEYNAAGQLVKITDMIGLTSQFTYGRDDFMTSMTTPYGTTTFTTGVNPSEKINKWVAATDQYGDTERVEFRHNAPGIAANDPPGTVPTGMSTRNDLMHLRNSFYWNKKTWHDFPGDYTKARITHWLHTSANQTSGVKESVKPPDENRVWYNYPGQTSPVFEGNHAKPSKIGRVLDDGTTQLYQYTYNDVDGMTSIIDPMGRKTVFTHLSTLTDQITDIHQQVGTTLEQLAHYTYPTARRYPDAVTDAAGQTTTYNYDFTNGLLLSETNAKGQTTTYAYNADKYLTSVTGPVAGATTTFTHDGFGRIRTTADSDNYTLIYDYDALDRPTRITYPDGTYQEMIYDKLDLASVRDRLGRTTVRQYDALRRLISITDPANRATTFDWCNCGGLSAMTDAGNHTTVWMRDLQGRVETKRLADGTTTQYDYEDATGRLKSITDAKGQVQNFQYFADNNLKQVSYTNSIVATPTVSFTYDPNYNRRASMTDGNGITTIAYRPVGQLGALQLSAIDGPLADDTISYVIDELGRPLSRSINGVAQTKSYDALGRTTSVTNPLGTFTMAYDALTRRIAQISYPNGQTATMTYSGNTGDHRLQQIDNRAGTTVLSQFSYVNDAEGQIRQWTQEFGTVAINYDLAGQMTTYSDVQPGGGYGNYSFQYDLAGNRTTEQSGSATYNFSYDEGNKLVARTGFLPATYTHDANGNLISDGNRTFEWDAENRLLSIYDGTTRKRSEFSYDGLGRRTRIVEKERPLGSQDGFTTVSDLRYVWCDSELCEERNAATGAVVRRFFDLGVQEVTQGQSPVNYYYAKDHLGSIRQMTDQTGKKVGGYAYDAWGRTTKINVKGVGIKDIPFGYAGYFYHKVSGLYLTWFRAYDPSSARWLSRDPIAEKGGLNLYGYVGNSPISQIDPTGLNSLACVWCVIYQAAYYLCLTGNTHNPFACLDLRLQASLWCSLCKTDLFPPTNPCPPGELPPVFIPPIPTFFNLCDLFPGLDGCPGGPNYQPGQA